MRKACRGNVVRAGDCPSVASRGVQVVLAMAIAARRSATDVARVDDPRHGDQEPEVGAERIRGELLKLGIRVSKRTIQRYMKVTRKPGDGQRCRTFIKNHTTCACDFVQTFDALFRPIFDARTSEVATTARLLRRGAREAPELVTESPNAGQLVAASHFRNHARSELATSTPSHSSTYVRTRRECSRRCARNVDASGSDRRNRRAVRCRLAGGPPTARYGRARCALA